MQYLKEDTGVTVTFGPFLSISGGTVPMTAFAFGASGVSLSKNGVAIAARNSTNKVLHYHKGWYGIRLNATDTNTSGLLDMMSSVSVCLPVWQQYMVVSANVYDSLFAAAGTDYLQVDTLQWDSVEVNATGVTIEPADPTIAGVSTRFMSADGLTGLSTATSVDHAATLTYVTGLSTRMMSSAGITGLSTAVAADVAEVKAETVLILADTNELQQDDIPTQLAGVSNSLGNSIGVQITGVSTRMMSSAGFTGLSTAVAADMAAHAIELTSVSTYVSGVLNTVTVAEMAQGAPSVTPTVVQMLNFNYRILRNKLEAIKTGISIYDDAGSTVLFQSTISDDLTTFIRGEFESG